MKRSSLHAILTLAIALLAVMPLLAQEATQPKAQPKAMVEEPIHDAGRTNKGTQISHDFVVKNDGDAPLEIREVRPACGCTVADYDETIAPGESGEIHAVLDTTDFTGGISKGLTVITNDPENPRLVLTIKAMITPSVYLRPGFARFVQTQASEPGVVEQIVFTRDMEDLEITKAESPYDFLTVETRKATSEERLEEGTGDQWVVTLSLDYATAPIGSLADYVRLHTNHPEQAVVSVPVSGFVRPMFVFTPEEADFGRVELEGDGTWAAVILKNYTNENMSVELENADALPEGVEVAVSPIEEGRQFKLEITLSPDLPKGSFDDVIRLKTGLAKQPVIEIPLKGTRI